LNPYRSYSSGDDPRPSLYDRGFRGVDMSDPGQVDGNWASEAVNYRFERGRAVPRGGVRPLWRLSASLGPAVQGAGVYDDPNGQEWLIAVVDGHAWRMREGTPAYQIPLAEGVTITGRVLFVQAFDRLFCFRGDDTPPLVLESFFEGFRLINEAMETAAGRGTGTLTIPNARWALYWQNRLVLTKGEDEGVVSDALNYTRYAVVNSMRVNAGSGDDIVGIWEFSENTLVVGKQRSIHIVAGLEPNEYGNFVTATRKTLESEFGIVAARSVVAVGTDLWALSERGVVSIRQAVEGLSYGVSLTLSRSIQPIIDRIAWRYASGAVATFADNRYYLAVPLDDAEIVSPVNLLAGSTHNPASGETVLQLSPGCYRWQPGAGESIAVNGTEWAEEADVEVASGDTVMLYGVADTEVLGVLRHVLKRVNNAVLVFHTANQERDGAGNIVHGWEGYSCGEGICVVDWMRANWGGKERLFFLGANGAVSLWGEGFEDQVWRPKAVMPYTELEVQACPASGDSAQCGAANAVSVTSGAYNTPIAWGCKDLVDAAGNFDGSRWGQGGFTPGHWLPEDAVSERTANGIRTYGQSWTIAGDWARARQLPGAAVVLEPIATELVTRGYHPQDGSLAKFGRLEIEVETWSPVYDVYIRADKTEAPAARDVRKDAREYYTQGLGRYALDNASDNHGSPKRKDYSVHTSAGGFYLGTGIAFDRLASATEAFKIDAAGRWCQIVVRARKGRVVITAAAVDYTRGAGRMGTKA
jgi:hypothetical protein